MLLEMEYTTETLKRKESMCYVMYWKR